MIRKPGEAEAIFQVQKARAEGIKFLKMILQLKYST